MSAGADGSAGDPNAATGAVVPRQTSAVAKLKNLVDVVPECPLQRLGAAVAPLVVLQHASKIADQPAAAPHKLQQELLPPDNARTPIQDESGQPAGGMSRMLRSGKRLHSQISGRAQVDAVLGQFDHAPMCASPPVAMPDVRTGSHVDPHNTGMPASPAGAVQLDRVRGGRRSRGQAALQALTNAGATEAQQLDGHIPDVPGAAARVDAPATFHAQEMHTRGGAADISSAAEPTAPDIEQDEADTSPVVAKQTRSLAGNRHDTQYDTAKVSSTAAAAAQPRTWPQHTHSPLIKCEGPKVLVKQEQHQVCKHICSVQTFENSLCGQ